MQSKTRLGILTFITVSLLVLSQTATYAQEGGVQHENFFVRMFHSFLQVIHVEKKTTPAVQTVTAVPAQEPGNVQQEAFSATQNKRQDIPATLEEQKARDTDRLSELVKKGTITEAQKAAIMTELEAMRLKYGLDIAKNLSQSERATQFASMQQELKDWAAKQNIPIQYVLSFGGPRGDRGPRPSGLEPSGTQARPMQNDIREEGYDRFVEDDRNSQQGGPDIRPNDKRELDDVNDR